MVGEVAGEVVGEEMRRARGGGSGGGEILRLREREVGEGRGNT